MQISTTMAIDRKIPNTLLSLSSVLIFDLAVFTGDCIRLHRDNHALNRYFIDFRKDRPIEAVNELQGTVFPSSERRGGCAIKKMLRSLLMKAQTGWSVLDNVTTSTFTIMTPPSAPLRRLLAFFLLAQPPPCSRRGTPCFGNSFTPS